MFRALSTAMLFFVFSLVLALASAWGDEEKHLYMLSHPIEQTTHLDKRLAYGIFGFDVIWSAGKGFTYYHLSHSPAAFSVIAWDLSVSQLPIYEVKARAALETLAWWHRRRDLVDIAQVKGVNDIRIVTVARPAKDSKIFEKSLDSTSTVFVETTKPLEEKDHKGNEWVEIHPDDNAKWKFRLMIDGEAVRELELPLQDIFDGAQLDQDLRKDWSQLTSEIKESILRRHMPYVKHTERYSIENVLVLNGAEVEKTRGTFATAGAVDKLLGTAFLQKLNKAVWNDFFDYSFPESKKVYAKNYHVVDEDQGPASQNSCVRTIKKVLDESFAQTLKRESP
jgi:hypothetical protein